MNRIEDLLQRYFENKVSEKERREVLRLFQTGSIEETVKNKIAQSLSDRLRVREWADEKLSAKGEEIFQSILKNNASVKVGFNPSLQGKEIKKSRDIYRIALPFAAVFIVLILAGIFVYPWKSAGPAQFVKESELTAEVITVHNNASTVEKVTLKDGSTVMLEPGGELRYNENFLTCREVYLSGDAFFEVVKNAAYPFYVHANEITTKVLGTSFRVKANLGEKEIVVAVKTGKVSVFAKSVGDNTLAKDVQEITLTPNQQAIYKRTEHVVVKKIVEEPRVINAQAAVKDSYVNESVVLILEALGKSYGVDIRFDREALSDCTLTSDIIEGEGLYDQLEIVCNALGGTYKMENDASIVIEANGCRSMNVRP